MDRAIDGAQELPKSCGRVVTQGRPLAADEYSGHPSSVVARGGVAYCVNAPVEAVELSLPHSFRHTTSTQARLFELPQRYDPVLARSGYRHPSIDRVAFVPHQETKSTGTSNSPP